MTKVTQRSVKIRQPRTPLKGLEVAIAASEAKKDFQIKKYQEWKNADLLRTEAEKAATAIRTRREIAMERALEKWGIVVPDGVSVLKVFNENAARRRADKI